MRDGFVQIGDMHNCHACGRGHELGAPCGHAGAALRSLDNRELIFLVEADLTAYLGVQRQVIHGQASTSGHLIDLDSIKADHGLAQVRCETERWNVQQHRLGVSFKQGHRSGFWDGVAYTLAMQAKVDELDIDEWLAELDKGEGSLYFTVLAPDPTRRVYCPGDDAFTVINRGGVCDACGYDFRGER